jgi:aspartyl-tRNA(Asn)/glutamyl-tRNA(Gln) amidotransferase subunit A
MPSSIVESIKSTLETIERRNKILNAFVKVMPEAALAQAKRVEAADEKLLSGLAVGIKDIIDVEGVVSGCGSLTRAGAGPATRDAHVVRKLREAGAVIVGKTHTVEYAFGGYGTNVTVGTPRNPWDLSVHRVPGGSSSGSGAAVGGQVIPAALGTDTGGSVRIPAALCGCVGLKTSIGLVSRTGVAPLSVRLDTVGPLAKDVHTAARMLAAIMGPDAEDPSTAHDHHLRPADVLDRLEDGIEGMRFATLEERDLPLASSEVKADYAAAIKKLEQRGAHIGTVSLPERLATYLARVGKLVAVEGYGYYRDLVENPNSGLAEPVRQRMLAGKDVTPAQLEELDAQRKMDQRAAQSIFDGFDAIVVPTVPLTAMPVSEVDETTATYATHTRWVNYLELAGLTVPTALSQSGLPMSLQIVVRRFDDPLALRIGRAFEIARGAFPRPPAG